MGKRVTSLPAATIAADCGLFIHFGRWRPAELERLKKGAGRWMRRIEAAMEHWREQLGAGAVNIVAVVLLYRRRERGFARFDVPETIESERGATLRIGAPIVVELGEIGGAQVEALLRGCGKALDETREAMRLVHLRVADGAPARIFVPIVATYVAPWRPRRLRKDRELGEGAAIREGQRVLAIRYFRASRAKLGRNRARITIV